MLIKNHYYHNILHNIYYIIYILYINSDYYSPFLSYSFLPISWNGNLFGNYKIQSPYFNASINEILSLLISLLVSLSPKINGFILSNSSCGAGNGISGKFSTSIYYFSVV